MEPFDYPDNDPGPQTLLTSLSRRAESRPPALADEPLPGLCRHRQLHGRALHLDRAGARRRCCKETARRGLIYVDDGSSPRSLAGQIAGANNLPFAKAEIMLDAVPTPRISTRRWRGSRRWRASTAARSASPRALPASIERIAQWAKAAEGRGIVLVPITAVAIKPKSS